MACKFLVLMEPQTTWFPPPSSLKTHTPSMPWPNRIAMGIGRIVAGATNGYYFFGNGNGTNNFSTFYGSGSWNDCVDNTPASSVANASILGAVSDGTNATPYQNGSALNTKILQHGGGCSCWLNGRKASTGNNSQYWDGHMAKSSSSTKTTLLMSAKKWKVTSLKSGV